MAIRRKRVDTLNVEAETVNVTAKTEKATEVGPKVVRSQVSSVQLPIKGLTIGTLKGLLREAKSLGATNESFVDIVAEYDSSRSGYGTIYHAPKSVKINVPPHWRDEEH